jgi:GH43 family beta-xylosidase
MKKSFNNLLFSRGADPWMYKHKDGYYYYMMTLGDRLDVWKFEDMSEIKNGMRKTVWTPSSSGPGSHNLWAPEIHYVRNKWYIYFTANDGGGDESRKIYVLENSNESPLEGEWIEKGAVNTNHPGLDGTVFEQQGNLYFLYAGYGHFPEYGSAIYICKMGDPWTLKGSEVLLTKPDYDWEKQGGMAINEGPVMLRGKDKLFLVYSASTTWSDDYSLGMLTASKDCDPMNVKEWKKERAPVFKKSIKNGVYAPGHNSFTKSADDTENWIVYHAIPESNKGSQFRNVRAQRFFWRPDGTPDFGEPVSL